MREHDANGSYPLCSLQLITSLQWLQVAAVMRLLEITSWLQHGSAL